MICGAIFGEYHYVQKQYQEIFSNNYEQKDFTNLLVI